MRRLLIIAVVPLVLFLAAPALACGEGLFVAVGRHAVVNVRGAPCHHLYASAALAPTVILPALPQMVPSQVKVANAPYYPPAPPPPTVTTRQEPKPSEPFSHVGLKYLPGVVTELRSDGPTIGFAQSLGVEVRATNWLTIRSDLELRPSAVSWDMVGVKLSAPWRVFSPFISGSVTGSTDDAHVGHYSLGVMAAAGFDLKFGQHFFITAEARYRVAPTPCCREQPQLVGLVGAGVAFF